MDMSLHVHHECVRAALTHHAGYEAATEGDSFLLAFHTARSAALFAVEVQGSLLHAPWPVELLGSDLGLCREVWVAPGTGGAAGNANGRGLFGAGGTMKGTHGAAQGLGALKGLGLAHQLKLISLGAGGSSLGGGGGVRASGRALYIGSGPVSPRNPTSGSNRAMGSGAGACNSTAVPPLPTGTSAIRAVPQRLPGNRQQPPQPANQPNHPNRLGRAPGDRHVAAGCRAGTQLACGLQYNRQYSRTAGQQHNNMHYNSGRCSSPHPQRPHGTYRHAAAQAGLVNRGTGRQYQPQYRRTSQQYGAVQRYGCTHQTRPVPRRHARQRRFPCKCGWHAWVWFRVRAQCVWSHIVTLLSTVSHTWTSLELPGPAAGGAAPFRFVRGC